MGGKNYGGESDLTTTGALDSGLDDLITGYGKFENDTSSNADTSTSSVTDIDSIINLNKPD